MAMQATAAAAASMDFLVDFLQTAAWWPKAANPVSVGFGSKQEEWRDIAGAVDIEGGMKAKVDRKGGSALCASRRRW
jgi:hypothetical protein